MRPVLFEIFGLPLNSYGISKALAVLVAGYLLAREFRRLGGLIAGVATAAVMARRYRLPAGQLAGIGARAPSRSDPRA